MVGKLAVLFGHPGEEAPCPRLRRARTATAAGPGTRRAAVFPTDNQNRAVHRASPCFLDWLPGITPSILIRGCVTWRDLIPSLGIF